MLDAACRRHAAQPIQWADLGLRPGISLGFFTLRFYSLAYLAGILLGYWHLSKMIKAPGARWPSAMPTTCSSTARSGVILGGRLGYAAFYTGGDTGKPSLFTHFTPGERISWDLLRLWDGGMSFHGGVIGTAAGDRLGRVAQQAELHPGVRLHRGQRRRSG